MSYASKNKTGAICLILLMVVAVVFVLMMLNGCTVPGGGRTANPLKWAWEWMTHGPKTSPQDPETSETSTGAVVSWASLQWMSWISFLPGLAMFVASFFVPGIGRQGIRLMGIGLIIALIPWAADTLMTWLLGEVGPFVKWSVGILFVCATLATITYASIFLWHEYKHRRGLCNSRLKGI